MLEWWNEWRAPFVIDGPEVIVGSANGCGLRLENATVAAHHARISSDAGGAMWVEDLDTQTGTLRNGDYVYGRQPLAEGDRLQIGGVTLVYRAGSAAALASNTASAHSNTGSNAEDPPAGPTRASADAATRMATELPADVRAVLAAREAAASHDAGVSASGRASSETSGARPSGNTGASAPVGPRSTGSHKATLMGIPAVTAAALGDLNAAGAGAGRAVGTPTSARDAERMDRARGASSPAAESATTRAPNAPNTNAPNTNAPNTNASNTNAPNTNASNTLNASTTPDPPKTRGASEVGAPNTGASNAPNARKPVHEPLRTEMMKAIDLQALGIDPLAPPISDPTLKEPSARRTLIGIPAVKLPTTSANTPANATRAGLGPIEQADDRSLSANSNAGSNAPFAGARPNAPLANANPHGSFGDGSSNAGSNASFGGADSHANSNIGSNASFAGAGSNTNSNIGSNSSFGGGGSNANSNTGSNASFAGASSNANSNSGSNASFAGAGSNANSNSGSNASFAGAGSHIGSNASFAGAGSNANSNTGSKASFAGAGSNANSNSGSNASFAGANANSNSGSKASFAGANAASNGGSKASFGGANTNSNGGSNASFGASANANGFASHASPSNAGDVSFARRTSAPVVGSEPPLSARKTAQLDAPAPLPPPPHAGSPASLPAYQPSAPSYPPAPSRAPREQPSSGLLASLTRAAAFATQIARLAKQQPVLLRPLVYNIYVATPVMALFTAIDFLVRSAPLANALLAVGIFLLYFIDYGCNALTCSLVYDSATGTEPTVRAARVRTERALPGILTFAAGSAAFDLLTTWARERNDVLARLLLRFVRALWTTATYVVLPTLILERATFAEALARSRARMGHDPTGVGAGVVALSLASWAVGALCVPLVWLALHGLGAIHPALGVLGAMVILNSYWAITGWMKVAYATCFYLWALECERAGSADPALAPMPLRVALQRA